jgi:hypothetical protein
MDVSAIKVSSDYDLVFIAPHRPRKAHTDIMGGIRRDLTRFETEIAVIRQPPIFFAEALFDKCHLLDC